MNFEKIKDRAPFGKVKLTIEYNGSNYSGWQRQAPGILTIQDVIEKGMSELLLTHVDVVCAGRTDAGVHALNQIAHFIAPKDVRGVNFVHASQALIPKDITIKKAELMPYYFHAQRSATAKTYIYRIWNEPVPSALRAWNSLWLRKPLNIERLNQAAQHFVGTHDFESFRSEGSAVKSTVRTVHYAKFIKSGDFVEFHINGTGFLKQMVRNIVGTLIQVELNDRHPDSIPELIKLRDRRQAGPTVPAQGLFLEKVFYTPELDNTAQPL